MRLAMLGGGLLLAALACTGGVAGNTSNREACEAYVDHVNALESCIGLRYDATNLCTGVHLTSVDMSPYFDCLREHTACNGTEPLLELDVCEPPTEEPG